MANQSSEQTRLWEIAIALYLGRISDDEAAEGPSVQYAPRYATDDLTFASFLLALAAKGKCPAVYPPNFLREWWEDEGNRDKWCVELSIVPRDRMCDFIEYASTPWEALFEAAIKLPEVIAALQHVRILTARPAAGDRVLVADRWLTIEYLDEENPDILWCLDDECKEVEVNRKQIQEIEQLTA